MVIYYLSVISGSRDEKGVLLSLEIPKARGPASKDELIEVAYRITPTGDDVPLRPLAIRGMTRNPKTDKLKVRLGDYDAKNDDNRDAVVGMFVNAGWKNTNPRGM